jgi:hypothetical protein
MARWTLQAVPRRQLASAQVCAMVMLAVQTLAPVREQVPVQEQVRFARPKLVALARAPAARLVLNQFDQWNLKHLHEWFDHQDQCRQVHWHQCRDLKQVGAQLVREVCLKHLVRSRFALQLQRPRQVEWLALVPARARVLVLVLVQAERRARALVLVQVQAERRVLARVSARVSARVERRAQSPQLHSPPPQLQSQCRPVLCHLH